MDKVKSGVIKRLEFHLMDNYEIINIFKEAMRCSHYCPVVCTHDTYGYGLSEIESEIMVRMGE